MALMPALDRWEGGDFAFYAYLIDSKANKALDSVHRRATLVPESPWPSIHLPTYLVLVPRCTTVMHFSIFTLPTKFKRKRKNVQLR